MAKAAEPLIGEESEFQSMWCFSWFKHDPSKDDTKTAKEISRHEEEDRRAREQIEIAKAQRESLKLAEQEEEMRRLEKSKKKGKTKQVDDEGQVKPSKDHVEKEDVNLLPSICNGCNSAIEDGIYVNAFDVLWHPLCLRCLHCQQPIAMNEISNSKGQFHRPCYRKHHNPNCYVCEKKLPLTSKGREFSEHPFWKEKYCPIHDGDGTAKCCSCERLESCGTKYVNLEDGRWLCRECMECAVMDTVECHNLHLEIREFFEASLNMKIDNKFPLLLVEKEVLNKAEKEENIDNHYGMVTRGICLSKEQPVTSVTKWRRFGPNKQLIIDMDRKSQTVVRECEVTAILILYGLPRAIRSFDLTNAAAAVVQPPPPLLRCYGKLNEVLEEGLCQVLGHMWLEPQTYTTPDVVAAAATADASSASSSSSSRTPPATTTSKKCDPSVFEKKLVQFCKYQIETDESPVYGDGFRKVGRMMKSNHYSLKDTLKDIVSASKTIPVSKF